MLTFLYTISYINRTREVTAPTASHPHRTLPHSTSASHRGFDRGVAWSHSDNHMLLPTSIDVLRVRETAYLHFTDIYMKDAHRSDHSVLTFRFQTSSATQLDPAHAHWNDHESVVEFIDYDTPTTEIIRSRNASSTDAPSGRVRRGSARTASQCFRLVGRSGYSQWVASIWKVRPWRRWGRDSSCPWECPDRSPPGCWCCSGRCACGTSPETWNIT